MDGELRSTRISTQYRNLKHMHIYVILMALYWALSLGISLIKDGDPQVITPAKLFSVRCFHTRCLSLEDSSQSGIGRKSWFLRWREYRGECFLEMDLSRLNRITISIVSKMNLIAEETLTGSKKNE